MPAMSRRPRRPRRRMSLPKARGRRPAIRSPTSGWCPTCPRPKPPRPKTPRQGLRRVRMRQAAKVSTPLQARAARVVVAAFLLAGLLAAADWAGLLRGGNGDAQASPAAPLMLFTSLPIYWAEAPDIAASLGGQGEPHWARR